MRTLDAAILFVLIVLLGFTSYFFMKNLPFETFRTEEYSSYVSNISSNSMLFASAQFYPNMRFSKKEISYQIEDFCDSKKEGEIQEAFSLLEEKTSLRFYPVQNNPEIEIACSEQAPQEEITNNQFYIAGEGGPTEARNLSTGYLIMKGKVSLFKDEKCKETKLALHEILHVLGFDHNNNPKSIMYPITNCDQTIDQSIIDDINKLYLQESFPDLAILRVEANKSFYGASFKVAVINLGFVDAKESKIEIYAGSNKIANYSLGTLQPGMTSTLEVQNLRAAKSAKSLKFFTSYAKADELSLNNNQAEIFPIQN